MWLSTLLLVLAAAPRSEVRFVAELPSGPDSLALNTRVALRGCDAGRCEVELDGGVLQLDADALAPAPVTAARAAQAADDALKALPPDARTLHARAHLQTSLGHRREALALASAAITQAVREAGSGARLAAEGVTSAPPAVRDGEAIVAVCHDSVARGRVKVRAREGLNGWEYVVSGPCPQSAGRAARGEVGAWLIAGLADATPQRGAVVAPPTGAPRWTWARHRLHEHYGAHGRWLINDETGARSLLPAAMAIFVGDVDGDGQVDGLLQQDGSCSSNVGFLMLSSKSPDPSVPVTVASAIGEFGVCD